MAHPGREPLGTAEFLDAARRIVSEGLAHLDVTVRGIRHRVRIVRLHGPDPMRYAMFVEQRGARRPLRDAYDRFGLSGREMDVLALIVDGAQIARSPSRSASSRRPFKTTCAASVRKPARSGAAICSRASSAFTNRRSVPRRSSRAAWRSSPTASASPSCGATGCSSHAPSAPRAEPARDFGRAHPHQQQRHDVLLASGELETLRGDADRIADGEFVERGDDAGSPASAVCTTSTISAGRNSPVRTPRSDSLRAARARTNSVTVGGDVDGLPVPEVGPLPENTRFARRCSRR